MTNTVPAVLIVDDEQETCDLLCEVLGDQGYVCQAVNSAEAALATLKDHDFDLALLDIRMPGMSGLDLLEVMSHSYRNTSVLMTTAVNDTKTAVDAMRRGAADYIVKPFPIDEVRARVAKVLRDKSLQGMKSEETTKLGRHEPGTPHAVMDAIAVGVEAQVARYDFHARIVSENTAEVARQMGISEKDIKAWQVEQKERIAVKETQLKWATGDLKQQRRGKRQPRE